MKIAIYAGSFDILTYGHMWIIRQGANLFEKLFVAVGTNPDKSCLFEVSDRVQMLEECLQEIESENVEVVKMENKFLVNFAKDVGAGWYIRGIRNPSDYAFEKTIAEVNAELLNNVYPIWIPSNRKYGNISSSVVRSLIGPEGWEQVICNMVPTPIYKRLLKEFSSR